MNHMPEGCRPACAPRFTPKQGQYLAFIHAYTLVIGRPPAEADLQRFFQVTPPSVHQMVITLERNGLICRPSERPEASRCWSIPERYRPSTPVTINPSILLCRGTSAPLDRPDPTAILQLLFHRRTAGAMPFQQPL